MKAKTNRCAKCGTRKKLTRHHVFPQRHFHGAGPIVILCRYDHDEIEMMIPFELVDDLDFYPQVVNLFLERNYLPLQAVV